MRSSSLRERPDTPLNPMMRFFASIRLTLVCLACAMALVFAGTLAQVELGLYAA